MEGWRGIDQGTQLKNTSGWNNDGNGINSSGFCALPGGSRGLDGQYMVVGTTAHWWSSTQFDGLNAWQRTIQDNRTDVLRMYNYKTRGRYVRCVKN